MPHLGPWEIAAIVLVVLILFGSKKLPGLGRSLAESIKNFKKGLKDEPSKKEKLKDKKNKQ